MPILDLGLQPPANAYVKPEDVDSRETKFPLRLSFCPVCSLLQVIDVVDPSILFKDYHFMTSASTPSVKHFEDYARTEIHPRLQNSSALVLEIGGNDGTLLSNVKNHCRVLNVDPADNLESANKAKGVPFMAAFFGPKVACEILKNHGYADLIVANNVFAHVDNLREQLHACRFLMRNNGTIIVEVHWVEHLITDHVFDQIYHEHLCYHSLHAFQAVAARAGLHVNDVKIVNVQGRSLRMFLSPRDGISENVRRVLEWEHTMGLTRPTIFQEFAKHVLASKNTLSTILQTLKAEGKRVVGYGAPAKGNTMLNFYDIGPELLEYLSDTTPLKQGMLSPGMHIPIVSPDRMRENPPDYALILPWNFKNQIVEQERALRERGTRFIVAFPELEII